MATRRAGLDAAEQGLKERERLRQEVQDQFGPRFLGYASPPEALRAIQTQREELDAKRKEIEAQVVFAEQEKARLSGQREAAQQEAAKLAEAQRGVTERLEADTRELDALGREIAAFLATNGDPERSVAQRRTTVMRAEQQMKEAEQALRQLESACSSLNTTQVQKDGDLKLLAVEYEGALHRAEREAQAVRAGPWSGRRRGVATD